MAGKKNRPASLGHWASEIPFRDDANREIGVPGCVTLGSGGFLEFDFGGVAEGVGDAGEKVESRK